MPRSKSKVRKVENYKKREVEEDDDFLTSPLEQDRIEKHSKRGFRAINASTKRLDIPPSKKLLDMGGMNVKKPKEIVWGKRTRRRSSKKPKRVYLDRGRNPDYTTPTPPVKKSCCERWFRWGSKKRNKKCKKKCGTRKRRGKKGTRKRKKKRKRKR